MAKPRELPIKESTLRSRETLQIIF